MNSTFVLDHAYAAGCEIEQLQLQETEQVARFKALSKLAAPT